jgi:4-hydroxybenzoate polyprenyltransferase
MQTTTKRSLKEVLLGLLLLSHPVPVLFHMVAITIFTLLAAWPHPVWSRVVFVLGAHAAMQLAISAMNDYCDRQLDATSKPGKPIPRGLITSRESLGISWLMIVLMVLLLLPLPPLAWGLSLFYLALAMAYNLGLKSTPFSGIVFALAIPLIPLYAFAGIGRNISLLAWLVPVGFFLGVALNLANSLPDLEEDAANGARTLAVTLGVKRAFLLSNTLLMVSALSILLLHLTSTLVVQPLWLVGTLMLAALLFAAMLLLTGATKSRATRKTYFYLVTLACIVLAGGWLTGVLI